MKFENPTGTVLYTIEQAIKAYRKLAQKNIQEVIPDLTIDQGLALLVIHRHPDLTQVEIAKMIFKDFASLTRMINLMDKKGYLQRRMNPQDRRRFRLHLTKKGKDAIQALEPVIDKNRSQALRGFSPEDITQLHTLLQNVISNCTL